MNLRRQKLLLEPPTTAAPDIAFILIIFFLVCASTQPDDGRAQEIPKNENKPEEKQEQENVEVSISRGTLLVNGNPVTLPNLLGKIGGMMARRETESDRVVIVKSASDTDYQRWIDVTSTIEQAGGIVTLQLEEEQTTIVE